MLFVVRRKYVVVSTHGLGEARGGGLVSGVQPVVVATARTPTGYSLSVQDNGSGIAAQNLINARRPFGRLDPARGGNGNSGLGLAIVERLVRRAGGEWEIDNYSGRGMRVLMCFQTAAVHTLTGDVAHDPRDGA